MSTRQPSRATLHDVIEAVQSAQLPERKKNDLTSAVRTVARVLGANTDALAADPAALVRRLAQVSPVAQGISNGRWANVRSLLGTALALVRPMMKGRSQSALLPKWEALVVQLATQSSRTGLSRLLRWLSERGVGPSEVSLDDIALFRAALMADSLLNHPKIRWGTAARAWNEAVRSIPGWPAILIERPTRKDLYSLPWEAFPASLKQDVDAWLRRLAGLDFAEDGPIRPARPATLITREYQLRASASALVCSGRDPATVRSLADLIGVEAYTAILRFMRARAGERNTSALHERATMLKSVAQHWVGTDEATLTTMRRIAARLRPQQSGMTQKNRVALRALEDDDAVQRLLSLPGRLMDEADRRKPNPRMAAVKAQLAVAIEFLIFMPVRRQNLCAIDIDKHLVRVGRKLHLVFRADEVKNRENLEFEVPEASQRLLDRYLERHRRLLAVPGCNALFPAPSGGAKRADTLGKQIAAVTLRYTGLRLTPHQFRHAGAKMFLDMEPGAHEVMRRTLGHKSLETTSKFYIGEDAMRAARHFDAVIARRRETGLAPKSRPRTLGAPVEKKPHKRSSPQ